MPGLSRELGCGDFVKIEVVHDSKYLLPDNYETIKATEILAKEGFVVMPYMYPDLNAGQGIWQMPEQHASCRSAAPIGSNKGLCTKDFIQILMDEIDLPIIVDAGIGRPSQACEAMEMGAAAVMANTADRDSRRCSCLWQRPSKKPSKQEEVLILSGLGTHHGTGAHVHPLH